MSYRPRLRTILLLVNILVLLLPLAGIAIFRLYESELVRQTESELISQATLTASLFRDTWLQQAETMKKSGMAITTGRLGVERVASIRSGADEFSPLPPKLDLAGSAIRPAAQPAETPTTLPDPVALQSGSRITPILADARKTLLSGLRIVDLNGIVVASSSAEIGLSLASREEVVKALAGEPASLLRKRHSTSDKPSISSISRRAGVRVFVAVPVVAENRVIGAVVASRTPLDAAKAMFLIRSHLLKAGAGLVLIVLLMSGLTAYYISRPVRALIRQAEQLKNGNPAGTEPLDNPGIQEVAQLSEAIARMAVALEERSGYIKAFATNVSHEFKTPLTSIHGAVEILKDHFHGMEPVERERFLEIIDSETGRLDRLVRRLLDLARADTVLPGDERTDACAVLNAVADRYRAGGVQIELACVAGPTAIRMGSEAFESVISNLVENARQHGGEGVRIQIVGNKTAETDGSFFELRIADDGAGIAEGNRDKVFRHFFTTARETGGSGLGLSIVSSLLNAHGGSITLEPTDSGACFRVLLPLC